MLKREKNLVVPNTGSCTRIHFSIHANVIPKLQISQDLIQRDTDHVPFSSQNNDTRYCLWHQVLNIIMLSAYTCFKLRMSLKRGNIKHCIFFK